MTTINLGLKLRPPHHELHRERAQPWCGVSHPQSLPQRKSSLPPHPDQKSEFQCQLWSDAWTSNEPLGQLHADRTARVD